jgi:hypothetical protein
MKLFECRIAQPLCFEDTLPPSAAGTSTYAGKTSRFKKWIASSSRRSDSSFEWSGLAFVRRARHVGGAVVSGMWLLRRR